MDEHPFEAGVYFHYGQVRPTPVRLSPTDLVYDGKQLYCFFKDEEKFYAVQKEDRWVEGNRWEKAHWRMEWFVVQEQDLHPMILEAMVHYPCVDVLIDAAAKGGYEFLALRVPRLRPYDFRIVSKDKLDAWNREVASRTIRICFRFAAPFSGRPTREATATQMNTLIGILSIRINSVLANAGGTNFSSAWWGRPSHIMVVKFNETGFGPLIVGLVPAIPDEGVGIFEVARRLECQQKPRRGGNVCLPLTSKRLRPLPVSL